MPYCIGPRCCRALRDVTACMACLRHALCAFLDGAGRLLSGTRGCCTTPLLRGLCVAVGIICHYLLQSLLMTRDLDAKMTWRPDKRAAQSFLEVPDRFPLNSGCSCVLAPQRPPSKLEFVGDTCRGGSGLRR